MSSELLPKMKILLFLREADEQMKHLELLLTIFFWQHLAKAAMNLRGKLNDVIDKLLIGDWFQS